GDYPPGSLLPTEDQFCTELEVSRTSLREAFKVLSSKGLLEARPKRGTIIKPRDNWNMLDPDLLSWCFSAGPSHEHVRHLYEFRSIIEPAAAAMAAVRASDVELATIEDALNSMKSAETGTEESIKHDLAFHQSILHASGNDLLIPLGYVIESALAQSIQLAHKQTGVRESGIPLHEEVFRAIQAHRPQAAQEAMTYLLKGATEDIESALSLVSQETN
ncbi:MAG: FadR family transcriptional regulator, partial [Gammaproteobacteria bacterium]|nr:FadR family transcriptional regulator [Gammaproteobacteria bacterium]